jgi:hypothetical protein
VVPRRARDGEVADDHQIELGQRLEREGLVVFVPEPAGLAEAIRTADDAPLGVNVDREPPLVKELSGYLREQLACSASPARRLSAR